MASKRYQKTRISGLMCYTAKDGTKTYHTHFRRDGANRWISHGADFGLATKKHYELMGSGPTVSSNLTLSEAHEQWRANYVAGRRCIADQKNVAGRWRNHAEPLIGARPLAKLTSEDCRKVALALSGKLSPESQRHVLADVRCFLNWCADEAGYLDKSPWPKRVMPRVEEQAPDRLSDEEVEAVLKVEGIYGFICRFFLGTGLRWGEGCRAQRSHVEGDVLVVARTKSGKMRRVPLHNPVGGARLLSDVLGRVGRLVPFSDRSHGSFSKVVKRLSGVPDFHVHRLRHTFACRYLEAGGSLVSLQQILGHASIETTQRYAKLTDEHVRAEARRLAGAR